MAQDNKSAALPPSVIQQGKEIYDRAVNPGIARQFRPLVQIVDLPIPPGRLAASVLRRWARSSAFAGGSFVWLQRRLRSHTPGALEHGSNLLSPFQSPSPA